MQARSLNPSNSPIVAKYRERTARSRTMSEQAKNVFPSGIVHDARKMDPYAIYVDRAEGARKWDVDGNEYIDYFGGHGALILGHNHPKVTAAVQQQLTQGTHYAACSELELRWGQLVLDLVPCAERVRFTGSGTEANLMAIRLARAFTGRDKTLRFLGHFHGWQDHVAFGVDSRFDGSAPTGVLPNIAENMVLAPAGDLDATRQLLMDNDVAAVLIEPTGGSFGLLPIEPEFLHGLREITQELGVLLIFDEVVTGFRVSRQGAQGHFGVQPDLASFAKILAGGLPGGAVAGRKDVLELLDFDAMASRGKEKIPHYGTF